LESFLKLVAIATIADIVPVTGENRIIVKHGLAGLRDIRSAGLRAILAAAGFADRIPNETEIAFRIAPAINASGRMDSAGAAVEMLLTADAERAAEIAVRLFALNTERQAAERAIVKEILDRCLEQPVTDADRALVFWGDGWHRGVAGIVASRVVEKFHRPAVVLGVEDGVAVGSGRSIEAFHLLEALESMRGLFTKFGGHAHAAGLTLAAGQLEDFRARLNAYAAERLTTEDMRETVAPDVVVEIDEVNEGLWDALREIGPFGTGNERPLFALRGVQLAGDPQAWNERHLKILVRKGGATRLLKGWGMGHLAPMLAGVAAVDVAFEMDRDLWGGWGLVARACRPAISF
jgi:single-stranded-DNA-specific exonuclease